MPFTYFVKSDVALCIGPEPINSLHCFLAVLGAAPLYAGPPFAPITGMHFTTHELYYLCFTEAKLSRDGIKRSTIFPGHLNDSVQISVRDLIFFVYFHLYYNYRFPFGVYIYDRNCLACFLKDGTLQTASHYIDTLVFK